MMFMTSIFDQMLINVRVFFSFSFYSGVGRGKRLCAKALVPVALAACVLVFDNNFVVEALVTAAA